VNLHQFSDRNHESGFTTCGFMWEAPMCCGSRRNIWYLIKIFLNLLQNLTLKSKGVSGEQLYVSFSEQTTASECSQGYSILSFFYIEFEPGVVTVETRGGPRTPTHYSSTAV
jgi:hypothetical protein